MFSNRIKNIKVSPIMKYTNLVNNFEKSGVSFIKLNIAQPNIITDSSYFYAIQSIKPNINGYSNPQGLEELRNTVSDYYNKKISKNKFSLNNVVITNGASDAIIKILISLCDEFDEIIVLEPFFSDYKIYTDLLNIKIKAISNKYINYDSLKKVVTDKTKAILFANPNNPDGKILTKEEAQILIDVAYQNNLFIISDEVYNEILYIEDYFSFSQYEYKNIIVVDSVSKKFSNCGSRIGFILCYNDELIKNIVKINDSKISISNTEQIGTINLFYNSEPIFLKQKSIYTRRLNHVINLLDKYKNIKYIKPSGGILLLLELPINDTEDFCNWLINEYRNKNRTLLITPAREFYESEIHNNEIRIPLTVTEETFDEAIYLLVDAIEKYERRN